MSEHLRETEAHGDDQRTNNRHPSGTQNVISTPQIIQVGSRPSETIPSGRSLPIPSGIYHGAGTDEEKKRLVNQDSEKKAQNRTSIDTNSKNEATEALTNINNDQKKVHPRIAQIGAEQRFPKRRDSVSSQNLETKELQIFKSAEDEEKKEKEEEDKQNIILHYLRVFLDSHVFQLAVNLLTIYSLFGDNIRIIATRKDADLGFDIITIIALSVFTIEILLSVLVKKGYIFSFFFWLDILSTISLILDINMVSNAIFYSGGSQVSGVAKAGQASRVGSKAGRVVRLVRLIRIVKLYKAAQGGDASQNNSNFKLQEKLRERKMKKKVHPSENHEPQVDSKIHNDSSGQINDEDGSKNHMGSNSNSKDQPQKKFNPPKESKVSKILTDITTKRVIVLVLVLVFIMPLFSIDYFFDPPTPIELAVKLVQQISQTTSTQSDIQKQVQFVIEMFDGANDIIVQFNTPFSFINVYQDSDYKNLRDDELNGSAAVIDLTQFQTTHPTMTSEIAHLQQLQTSNGALNVIGQQSTRSDAIFTAALSFGSTIFICIILTAGSILFSKDANDLALGPIERMRDKVIAIANDPLSTQTLKLIGDDENKEKYETVLIENAIVKIGTLLALGFGEAGSEIIAINMGRQGDVNAMIPGKKKCAIYGFCDIRNFTDATEVLQEEVMLFVNNIGEIVHTVTDKYLGAANKNIGDAFLLVWRIDPDKYSINDETNEIKFSNQLYISILSDYAGLAFLRIQCLLNRISKILAYRENKGLQQRIDHYKVKMGFGLHIGWGIEGAIGSEFKIDASYLSPNVNMAARLEAATKQYGVPLLISSDLQNYFSPEMKKYTRYIDRVTVKGSIRPIGLYTVDMDVENLPLKKEIDPSFSKFDIQGINQVKKEEMREKMKNALEGEEEWNADNYIKETKDLRLIFLTRNEQFQANFEKGFQKYLEGSWQECRNILNDGLKMCPDDGPTRTILEVMGGSGFQAPQDWKGFRELTEK